MNKLQIVFLRPFKTFLRQCHELYERLYKEPVKFETEESPATEDESNLVKQNLVEADEYLEEHFEFFFDEEDFENDESENNVQSTLLLAIEELDLSVRSYNCLKRAGINTAGEIAQHGRKWLVQNVRNLGHKSMDEIAQRLEKLDIYIPEATEEEIVEEASVQTSARDTLEGMVGLASVKERMNDIAAHCVIRKMRSEICGVEKPIVPNMLFLGNPGTGKTTVAKLAARVFKEIGLMKKGHLVCVTRADLVAEYTGQSAEKTTRVFKSALDGILFVDEAYALYHRTEAERAGDIFSQEVIDTLTALMTEYAGRCCVIFAGYSDEMNYMLENANPGLRERFPFKLNFEDYSAKEMQEIFMLKVSECKLSVTEECLGILDNVMTRICSNKNGAFANGRVVDNFLQEVMLCQERRLFERQQGGAELSGAELVALTEEDFSKAANSVIKTFPAPPVKRLIGFSGLSDAA